MWRNVLQTVFAHICASVGFCMSVLAHILGGFSQAPIHEMDERKPLLQEPSQSVKEKKSIPILITTANPSQHAIHGPHVSFPGDPPRIRSTSPARRIRPMLPQTASAPIQPRRHDILLNEKSDTGTEAKTIVPHVRIQNSSTTEVDRPPRRQPLRQARSFKSFLQPVPHSTKGQIVKAPVARTQPYAAPYFFPAPDSPDAEDYVQRVRDERRLVSQSSMTVMRGNKKQTRPTSANPTILSWGDTEDPPRSATLVAEPEPITENVGRRRPSWMLGRKPRPASFHEGDLDPALHRRKSSLTTCLEDAFAVSETSEVEGGKEVARKPSRSLFRKKPRTST